jgi:Putative  PD-(D/E)XK family member, (DUF4420)
MTLTTTSAWEQFCELKAANEFEGKGVPCGDKKHHLLVKGKDGEPILFLKSEPRHQPRAPIRLMNVIGEFDRKYSLTSECVAEAAVCSFTTFRCLPEAVDLHPYFVEMMVATAAVQPASLSERQVDNVVASLMELFRPGTAVGHSTVAGLWGELLVIASSADAAEYVQGWHVDPTDSFDFAFSEYRIEVKSSEKQIREHEFSLGQVSERRDGDYVASVLLKRSAAGASTLEFAEQIAVTLDDAGRAKLWGLVFRILGEDATMTNDVRYDIKFGKDNLRFIESNKIPAPVVNEKERRYISHVRYRANIESIVQDCGLIDLL